MPSSALDGNFGRVAAVVADRMDGFTEIGYCQLGGDVLQVFRQDGGADIGIDGVVQHLVVSVDGQPDLVAEGVEIAKAAVVEMALPVGHPVQVKGPERHEEDSNNDDGDK